MFFITVACGIIESEPLKRARTSVVELPYTNLLQDIIIWKPVYCPCHTKDNEAEFYETFHIHGSTPLHVDVMRICDMRYAIIICAYAHMRICIARGARA